MLAQASLLLTHQQDQDDERKQEEEKPMRVRSRRFETDPGIGADLFSLGHLVGRPS